MRRRRSSLAQRGRRKSIGGAGEEAEEDEFIDLDEQVPSLLLREPAAQLRGTRGGGGGGSSTSTSKTWRTS